MKSSTLSTESSGVTTRKYTTALTFTVTLSRVIASCEGTSMVITLRSTFTMRSTNGMRRMKPGPLTPTYRPRRKTTPRSYSWTILTAAVTMISKTTTMVTTVISILSPPLLVFHYGEFQPMDSGNNYLFARLDLVTRGSGGPALTIDQYNSFRVERCCDDAGLSHESFPTGYCLATLPSDNSCHNEHEKRTDDDGYPCDEASVDLNRRRAAAKKDQ